ncbi:MAG: hypothetical protein RL754_962 [Bacteroidota bacterium]|jgi:small subunit ribosomal protein S21
MKISCTFAVLKKGGVTMLVINVKEGESIERALKRYKRKHSSTGVVRKLRNDRYYTKPTEAKRRMMAKAAYVQGLRQAESE